MNSQARLLPLGEGVPFLFALDQAGNNFPFLKPTNPCVKTG